MDTWTGIYIGVALLSAWNVQTGWIIGDKPSHIALSAFFAVLMSVFAGLDIYSTLT